MSGSESRVYFLPGGVDALNFVGGSNLINDQAMCVLQLSHPRQIPPQIENTELITPGLVL